MTTNCLIVDDEPLARNLIREHIGKMPGFQVQGECGTAMEAMTALRENKIDLVFLDIQMPQISGLEFLRMVPQKPRVIITTAYREYALEGFELDVVDYLLKPITFERFFKAVSKYCQQVATPPMSENHGPANPHETSFIYVKENKKHVKVSFADILYVEGFSEYVKIFTQEKRIITKLSLSWMEEQLPEVEFLRIHKSYIIAVEKINAFTANTIEVGGKELPVGRSYKGVVSKALQFPGMASQN
ncbi:response regulator [Marinilabiliaceae bacterium JC017]|nr:response regulator [Marinilabiliaceae bacterium JC017]